MVHRLPMRGARQTIRFTRITAFEPGFEVPTTLDTGFLFGFTTVTEPAYPKREPFFSHKFVRILQKSCAAMDIGQNAALLLCFIAHTEDAARYSGPVRFWNEQLMTTMAFRSHKQLDRCRALAVEHGWLHYHREHKRAVGKYWVTIPERFADLPDTMIEDSRSVSLVSTGPKSGPRTSKEADNERPKNVQRSGPPSNPVPSPGPKPKKPRHSFADGDMTLARLLWSSVLDVNPSAKQPNFDAWANTVRLIRERDNREPEEIEAMIRWVETDDFWRLQILSPGNLRNKWDRLQTQRLNGRGKPKREFVI